MTATVKVCVSWRAPGHFWVPILGFAIKNREVRLKGDSENVGLLPQLLRPEA